MLLETANRVIIIAAGHFDGLTAKRLRASSPSQARVSMPAHTLPSYQCDLRGAGGPAGPSAVRLKEKASRCHCRLHPAAVRGA